MSLSSLVSFHPSQKPKINLENNTRPLGIQDTTPQERANDFPISLVFRTLVQ